MPGLPPAPAVAGEILGAQLELVAEYGTLLATDAVVRGLIGPRETDRLWNRHLLNCAVLGELIPASARVVDVGSGAGLPGLVLACARPDLTLDLVDSLARRTAFLVEAADRLGVSSRVRVHTGRVEDRSVRDAIGDALWVTARAVAPLDRLARWCLPLLRPGGRLLAIKGQSVNEEIAQHRSAVGKLGVRSMSLVECGTGLLAEPVRVAVVVKR